MKNFLKIKSEEFLHYMQHNIGASNNTIKTYRFILDESIELLDIEKNDDLYKIDLMAYRVFIKNQKNKTIAKKISAIRRFVQYLKEIDIKVRLLNDEQIKIPKQLPKPLNDKYIFEAIKISDLQTKLLIKVIFGLGLRISEVANLKLSDIDSEWIKIEHAKGDKTRMIAIHVDLQKEIQEYIKNNPLKKYLFELNNKKMNENQLRYKLQKLFKNLGITMTPHQLRHSFATDLLNNGARINDVSELLGHSVLSTTQIYTKVGSSLKLKNYEKAHPLCGIKKETFR